LQEANVFEIFWHFKKLSCHVDNMLKTIFLTQRLCSGRHFVEASNIMSQEQRATDLVKEVRATGAGHIGASAKSGVIQDFCS